MAVANHLKEKLILSKKRALIIKKAKLKKITIIKKEKSLQKRKKKILVNKKAKFKKIMLLKKRKKVKRLWDNKSLLKKRAEQRRRRQRKWRKKKERSRREISQLQLVSGDTVAMPVEHAIETVEIGGTQPVDYVSGELYNSIFPCSIETPIQVDSQLWDSIKENLPDNYMIPDPDFLEAVCIDDLPIGITSGMQPAILQPIDAPLEIILSEPEQESQSQLTNVDAVRNKIQLTDDAAESE
jgi:hypothetical protein